MDRKTINAIILLIVGVGSIALIFWISDLDSEADSSVERESLFSFSVNKNPINTKEEPKESISIDEIPQIKEEPKETSLTDPIKNIVTQITPQIEEKPKEITKESQETKTPSGEEVFNELWPNYYRSHLSEIQDYLVKENLVSNEYSLNSQENIYGFFNEYLLAYKDLAELSDEDFNDLQNKINNSKSIKQTQKKEIIGDISFPKLFGKIINTAHAGYVTGAFWYKDDAPGNSSPGVSSPNTCGNCGIDIRTGTNRFVFNCQAYGALCDIQLGCLNGTCRSFPNAIWDQSTTMCGCG